MTLPNFLCIGAQKAGTTWLYVNLLQHPSVWMPPVKELHFFNHLFVPDNRDWTRVHIQRGAMKCLKWHLTNTKKIDFSYVRYLSDLASDEVFTEGWYRKAFDRPSAKRMVLGDITPAYSTIPEQGIGYLRRLLGAVKIIYMVRHPVDRALSQIKMNIQRRSIDEFSETQWLEAADSWHVMNRSDYSTVVPLWKSHFASQDIKFVNYLDLKRRPHELMKEIEDFLGVPNHDEYKKLSKLVHKTMEIEVPAAVRTALEHKLQPQVDFVLEQFGPDFIA